MKGKVERSFLHILAFGGEMVGGGLEQRKMEGAMLSRAAAIDASSPTTPSYALPAKAWACRGGESMPMRLPNRRGEGAPRAWPTHQAMRCCQFSARLKGGRGAACSLPLRMNRSIGLRSYF